MPSQSIFCRHFKLRASITLKSNYGAVYMKEKLQEHFGEKIVITTVKNRNVVTFCSTVRTIISELHKQPKVGDYEVNQI